MLVDHRARAQHHALRVNLVRVRIRTPLLSLVPTTTTLEEAMEVVVLRPRQSLLLSLQTHQEDPVAMEGETQPCRQSP